MRSPSTKLVLSTLGILMMFASPAFAQEPHHHHRHASLQVRDAGPVGQSGRTVYNMVITPESPSQRGNIYNMVIAPNVPRITDDPIETGGGSVGYNEMIRDDEW